MLTKTQEVSISCRAVSSVMKKPEELSSFEDKALRKITPFQPGEKATQCELLQ